MRQQEKVPLEKVEDRLDLYARWHAEAKPYFRWQLAQFAPYLGDSVVDVGCGLGNFTELLQEKKCYVGVDCDGRMIATLRDRYAGRQSPAFLEADIMKPECLEDLRGEAPDSVLCVNVLEHIEDDRGALANMVTILPPGGHLCLLVPALQGLYGTLDALDGHFRRYDKRVMAERLAGLPLRVVRQYYFNLVGSLGWFLKGRVLKEKTQSDANYRVMNRLIPLLSRAERFVRPPFGMSLIVVAKKESYPSP